jgi:hypothetical protein
MHISHTLVTLSLCVPSSAETLSEEPSVLAPAHKSRKSMSVFAMLHPSGSFEDSSSLTAFQSVHKLNVNVSLAITRDIPDPQNLTLLPMAASNVPPSRIRLVMLADAPRLIAIYSHYVLKASVTFENETPTVSDFEDRIRKVTAFFPRFCPRGGWHIKHHRLCLRGVLQFPRTLSLGQPNHHLLSGRMPWPGIRPVFVCSITRPTELTQGR